MSRSKKHVLNAAKQKISNELMANYEKSVNELNKLLAECSEDGDTPPDLLDEIELSRKKVDEAHQKISDWKQKPRVKKKKAVTWSSDYEASNRPQRRVIKTEAYRDFKAASPATKLPVATWLEEGSLVCKRKQPGKAMIVLSVSKGSSELLNDGNVEWHRNLSLRPFEIEE